MRKLLIATLICASGAVHASHPHCDKAVQGFLHGYTKAARTAIKHFALGGDACAQNALGELHATGDVFPLDYDQAHTWFAKAAAQGCPEAKFHLGIMYEEGLGVIPDNTIAVPRYQQAADLGHARAQNNLAVLYQIGRGLTQSDERAAYWYRQAASQGHVHAQNNLGLMLTTGKGIPQDYVSAERWLRLAAEQGLTDAQFNLGVLYGRGLLGKADLVEAYAWWAEGGSTKAVEYRNSAAQQMSSEELVTATSRSKLYRRQ